MVNLSYIEFDSLKISNNTYTWKVYLMIENGFSGRQIIKKSVWSQHKSASYICFNVVFLAGLCNNSRVFVNEASGRIGQRGARRFSTISRRAVKRGRSPPPHTNSRTYNVAPFVRYNGNRSVIFTPWRSVWPTQHRYQCGNPRNLIISACKIFRSRQEWRASLGRNEDCIFQDCIMHAWSKRMCLTEVYIWFN